MRQVLDVVESSIGGMQLDTTFEGRERYGINVRYPRELRDNLLDGVERSREGTLLEKGCIIAELENCNRRGGRSSRQVRAGRLRRCTHFYERREGRLEVPEYVTRPLGTKTRAGRSGCVSFEPLSGAMPVYRLV